MPPDLALLISPNYPCLEHNYVVPKVFEPLKFYCIWMPKIMPVIVLNYAAMCLKDADEMANSVGPDQTAPLGAV